jgi:hypothetical protein
MAQSFGLLTLSRQFMVANKSNYGRFGLSNQKDTTNYLTLVKLFDNKKILKFRIGSDHSLVLIPESNTKTSFFTNGDSSTNDLNSQISS